MDNIEKKKMYVKHERTKNNLKYSILLDRKRDGSYIGYRLDPYRKLKPIIDAGNSTLPIEYSTLRLYWLIVNLWFIVNIKN